MHKPLVLVTGASGFIGSQLLPFLLQQDYRVVGLTRQPNRVSKHPQLRWIQQLDELDTDQIDYVINFAGESIGEGRWTAARKQKLLDSRVQTTLQLYQYLEKRRIFPKCIISGSAVGYYGIDPQEQWLGLCTEHSAAQDIFMSQLCQQWEQAALSFSQQNTKIMRLGVVFGRGGGILPQMLLPIRLNAVGRIGHGRQPVAWVHIQDVLQVIHWLMTQTVDAKILNVVAPEKTSQQDFAKTAARLLKRRPFFVLPAFVLRWLLGEQSQLVLNGQYVKPQALEHAGYCFQYPKLEQALAACLGASSST